MIDINDIEKQIQSVIAQKIEDQLSTHDLYNTIEQQIARTVDEKVNATITGLLNRLVNTDTIAAQVNTALSADIQEKLDHAVKSRVAQTVAQADVGTEISQRIVQFVEDRMARAALPDNLIPARSIQWDNFSLSADYIGTGTIADFTSTGIEDLATDVNLTVLDGQVVVENETVTKHLTVVESAVMKDLAVERLTINNDFVIKSSKFVEEMRSLIDGRIEKFYERPLDTRGGALTSNQVALISDTALGSSVVESNLRKLGRLTSLSVTGETNLADTVYVGNGKLGVNTDEPAGALTIWDEESELTVRKYKQRTMYVGSSRDSDLVLGVGGDAVVFVQRQGIATKSVKIGNVNITSASTVPNYTGSPGDLVISNASGTGPWAWRCTGGNSWIPLK